ncbi:UNVERIFIED_CONTAM: Retrovirus-related Pol polyprotein from transposon RE1, partial [Sesamum latifolium]
WNDRDKLIWSLHAGQTAFQVKGYAGNRPYMKKKKGSVDKRNLICEHCRKLGHTKDTCFKIHGVPDWYKDLSDQRKKPGLTNRAYATVEPEPVGEIVGNRGSNLVSDLIEALRLVQNKTPQDPVRVHFTGMEEMAGMGRTTGEQSGSYPRTWIVDSGATSHMCGDARLFHSVSKLTVPIRIHLPNNRVTFATQSGDIRLSPLLVPSFTCYLNLSLILEPLRDVVFMRMSSLTKQTTSATCSSDRQPLASSIDLPFRSPSTVPLDDIPIPSTRPPTSPPSSSRSPAQIVSDPIPLRRSQRSTRPPTWLTHYHCNLTPEPIVSSSDLTSSHTDFMAALSTIHEPSCYKEARVARNGRSLCSRSSLLLNRMTHGRLLICLRVDINNAFLHGFLDEDIYLTPPEGSSIPVGKVLYVDDVLLTHSSEAQIADVIRYLDSAFTIKDLGPAKYFLSLEIDRTGVGTSVTQHKFIRDIICDTGLLSAKPGLTPLPTGVKLSAFDSTKLADPEPYRRLVGRLLYLSFTRPDISFGAQQLSQFVQTPCQSHMEVALHLVRYLKGCPDRGLFFPSSNSFAVSAFCDADCAGCVDSRRSLTGYCIFLGDALIYWKTKKQTTVAQSTVEAEYRSLGTIACKLQWISFLLQDFGLAVATPIPLYCDNQTATHIVANPVFHERTKHLEIDCHLVRDHYKAGFLLPCYTSSKLRLVDMFTKLLL